MELLAALLLLQDKYAEAAKKIAIPDASAWAKESPEHAAIVASFTDRAKWAAAFKAVDGRFGLFRDDAPFSLTFVHDSENSRPARTTTTKTGCVMTLNFAALVPYQQKIEEAEKAEAEAKKQGQRVVHVLPPITHEATMVHELVHVYQQMSGGKDLPEWFSEGMSAYAEPVDAHVRYFVYDKKEVKRIDEAMGANDAYGRGWLFFAWAEERLGKEKFRAFLSRTVTKGEDPKVAIAELAGREWEKLLEMEKSWSEAKVKQIRKAMTP